MSPSLEVIQTLAAEDDVNKRRVLADEFLQAAMRTRVSLRKRGRLEEPAPAGISEQLAHALRESLADPDERVRMRLMEAAGHVASSEAVSSLTEQMRSESALVRLTAAIALGEIGGPEAVEALTTTLLERQEEPDVRLAAANGIEELVSQDFTSGPDRRPPGSGPKDQVSTAESGQSSLAARLRRLQADGSDDAFLRLKVGDIVQFTNSS